VVKVNICVFYLENTTRHSSK